jgi:hypothetical protein
MDNTTFIKGNLSTDFLERESGYFEFSKTNSNDFDIAAIAATLFEQTSANPTRIPESDEEIHTPWTTIGNWAIAGSRDIS